MAFAPRFAVSCSRELLEGVAALSRSHGLLVHTHASEQPDEVALVRARTGLSNVEYLHQVGLTSPLLCLAHCVWVEDSEQTLMAAHDVKVLHCPSSNLKLGSGLAPVVEMRASGISVSLGSDGAACNNRLDMFTEMRLAAGLQAVRRGPGALTARDAVWMATREGARAVGLADDIGQVTPGFRADLTVVGLDSPHLWPAPDPFSAIVYGALPSDVRMTVVDGEVLVEGGRLVRDDVVAIMDAAGTAARALVSRAF